MGTCEVDWPLFWSAEQVSAQSLAYQSFSGNQGGCGAPVATKITVIKMKVKVVSSSQAPPVSSCKLRGSPAGNGQAELHQQQQHAPLSKPGSRRLAPPVPA